MKIAAILLAAGSSTRMGDQDKLMLKYKGQWLVNHVMQQLWASSIDELIIVRKDKSEHLLNGLSSERIKVALNPLAEKGMTTSIQAGVQAADPQANGYMICQSDMPLIQTAEYDQLISAFKTDLAVEEERIAIPFFENKKGNPVIFSAHYKQAILAHQEMEGCRGIIKENFSKVLRVDMEHPHVLVDVDTAEDWERLNKDY